jgi:hypothetical protein
MGTFLTEKCVDTIFKEMNSYVLELANEPGALGPQYFQNIIAVCRNYLNKVSLRISELNRERLEVSSELRKLEALYALEYDNLLTNDVQIKSLASVEDRKAATGFHLREQQAKINELKDQMHALDSVYKVVNHRNRELHATMTAIKDQRRLMQVELSTGSFYGDERVPRGMVLDEDFNEDELATMLSESIDAKETSSEAESPEEIKSINPDLKPINPDPVEPEKAQSGQEKRSPQVTEEDVLRFLESSEEILPETPQQIVDQPQSDTKESDDLLPFLNEI